MATNARGPGLPAARLTARELADLEHGDDVGVREPGHREGLAVERAGGVAGVEELERDVAIEPRVAREVHGAHAAGAEHAGDHVVLGDDGAGLQRGERGRRRDGVPQHCLERIGGGAGRRRQVAVLGLSAAGAPRGQA